MEIYSVVRLELKFGPTFSASKTNLKVIQSFKDFKEAKDCLIFNQNVDKHTEGVIYSIEKSTLS